MTENKPDLDKWDDFSGKFIKTDLVQFPFVIVVDGLDAQYDDEKKARLVMEFQYNGRTWNMELNKTNQNFVRSCSLVPSGIIGKTLTFDETPVYNPGTKKNQPGFLLSKVE